MPFKKIKKDAADSLELEWVLQAKNYKLALDKKRCALCQICTLACPKQAISTKKPSESSSNSTRKIREVDIDIEKCNFCGICDITCPHGAIKVTRNNQPGIPVLDKESYPQLIRDISIDTRKCEKDCEACKTACPLGLIEISKVGYDGKPVKDLSGLSPLAKERIQVAVDIKRQYCPTCRACELKCNAGALKVRKFFEGKLTINGKKCPPECHECFDICPIKGTLKLNEKQKVVTDHQTCTFCGACKNVCPVPEALEVHRTKILHTPVHSGTWNKTLERLTSPNDAVKEFKAQAAKTRRDLVWNRFEVEELKKK